MRKQWKLIWERRRHGAMFPYWFLVLVFGGLAISPWTTRPKLRFSLRTLLIATTLVAVVLGMIVWMSERVNGPRMDDQRTDRAGWRK